MKIPGYSNWFTVFRPLRWLVPLAEQMYDVAGVFLAADTPLPDETVRLLQRIAGELGEIRDILGQPSLPVECGAPLKGHPKCCTRPLGHSDKHWNPYFGNWSADETSAPPVAHSRSPEDAAGGPPPIAPDSVSGGGHTRIEDPFRRAAELARLQRELDAARQERDNANARANAARLAP